MSRRSGVVVSHPTLNANSRALAGALADLGVLTELHTSFDLTVLAKMTRMLAPQVSQQVARRALPDIVSARTRSHPRYELTRLARRLVPALRAVLPAANVHGLYDHLDTKTAERLTEDLFAVVAYEDGARRSFEAAIRLGVDRYYDLPIPYWRLKNAILEEEADRNPTWASLLGGIDDPAEVLDRKTAELELAGTVFTASSISTRSVLEATPGKRVVQIAYGCPTAASHPRYSRGGRLRALFAGGLTQRKGLSYLFDAVAASRGAVDLTVVGTGAPGPSAALAAALAQHRYIPSMAQAQLLALMHDHDVLVLPSLVEGYGLVINEALSQGIPVITTANTGAADIFDGLARDWIVPVQNSQAISELLQRFAGDTDLLNASKDHARDLAVRNPWSLYVRRVQEEFRVAPSRF